MNLSAYTSLTLNDSSLTGILSHEPSSEAASTSRTAATSVAPSTTDAQRAQGTRGRPPQGPPPGPPPTGGGPGQGFMQGVQQALSAIGVDLTSLSSLSAASTPSSATASTASREAVSVSSTDADGDDDGDSGDGVSGDRQALQRVMHDLFAALAASHSPSQLRTGASSETTTSSADWLAADAPATSSSPETETPASTPASTSPAAAYRPPDMATDLRNLVSTLQSSGASSRPTLAKLESDFSTLAGHASRQSGRTPTLAEFLQALEQQLPSVPPSDAAIGSSINALA